jgi:hypothetical protein
VYPEAIIFLKRSKTAITDSALQVILAMGLGEYLSRCSHVLDTLIADTFATIFASVGRTWFAHIASLTEASHLCEFLSTF